jgi:hypothetical protein
LEVNNDTNLILTKLFYIDKVVKIYETTEESVKSILKITLLMLIGLLVMRTTCGKPRPTGEMQIKAIEKIKITDKVYYHNMSITFDGDNYFTINGGNTD